MTEQGAVITLREVYDLLIGLKQDMNDIPKKVDQHDVRISKIEARFWMAIGAATVIGVIAGSLLTRVWTSVGA